MHAYNTREYHWISPSREACFLKHLEIVHMERRYVARFLLLPLCLSLNLLASVTVQPRFLYSHVANSGANSRAVHEPLPSPFTSLLCISSRKSHCIPKPPLDGTFLTMVAWQLNGQMFISQQLGTKKAEAKRVLSFKKTNSDAWKYRCEEETFASKGM